MTIRTIVFSLVLATSQIWADVNLPAVISDGMVLQRGAAVPIWGWGRPGDAVTVKFANQSAEGVVKADGSWRVDFKPLEASSVNRSMTITVGADTEPFGSVPEFLNFGLRVTGCLQRLCRIETRSTLGNRLNNLRIHPPETP